MKKRALILPLLFITLTLLSSLVLAAVPAPAPELPFTKPDTSVAGVFKPLADIILDALGGFAVVFNSVLGAGNFGDGAFAKLLLFILVALVLFKPAQRIVDAEQIYPQRAWAVAIIVSVLGVFWIPAKFITTLLLPYNTLGIIAATFIPLAMIVYFIEALGPEGSTMRRMAWFGTAFAFLGVWLFRMGEKDLIDPTFHTIYFLAVALCFGAGVIEPWIQGLLQRVKGSAVKDLTLKTEIAHVRAKRASALRAMRALPAGLASVKDKVRLQKEAQEAEIEEKRLIRMLSKL